MAYAKETKLNYSNTKVMSLLYPFIGHCLMGCVNDINSMTNTFGTQCGSGNC